MERIALRALRDNIKAAANRSDANLVAEQQQAGKASKFQVFLHEVDVRAAANLPVSEGMMAEFFKTLGAEGTKKWLGASTDSIYNDLKDYAFAPRTEPGLVAFNTTIEQKLAAMPADEVLRYLDRLVLLASPMWTFDLQGYLTTLPNLNRVVIVGVADRNDSIISTTPQYSDKFMDCCKWSATT